MFIACQFTTNIKPKWWNNNTGLQKNDNSNQNKPKLENEIAIKVDSC